MCKKLQMSVCYNEAEIESALSKLPNDGDIVVFADENKFEPLYQCMKRYSDGWLPCTPKTLESILSNLASTVKATDNV